MAGIVAGGGLGIVDAIWAVARLDGPLGIGLGELARVTFLSSTVVGGAGAVIGIVLGAVAWKAARMSLLDVMPRQVLVDLALSGGVGVLLLATRHWYWPGGKAQLHELGLLTLHSHSIRQGVLLGMAAMVTISVFLSLRRYKSSRGLRYLVVLVNVGCALLITQRLAYETSRLGPMEYVHLVSVVGLIGLTTLIGMVSFKRMPRSPGKSGVALLLIASASSTAARSLSSTGGPASSSCMTWSRMAVSV